MFFCRTNKDGFPIIGLPLLPGVCSIDAYASIIVFRRRYVVGWCKRPTIFCLFFVLLLCFSPFHKWLLLNNCFLLLLDVKHLIEPTPLSSRFSLQNLSTPKLTIGTYLIVLRSCFGCLNLMGKSNTVYFFFESDKKIQKHDFHEVDQ